MLHPPSAHLFYYDSCILKGEGKAVEYLLWVRGQCKIFSNRQTERHLMLGCFTFVKQMVSFIGLWVMSLMTFKRYASSLLLQIRKNEWWIRCFIRIQSSNSHEQWPIEINYFLIKNECNTSDQNINKLKVTAAHCEIVPWQTVKMWRIEHRLQTWICSERLICPIFLKQPKKRKVLRMWFVKLFWVIRMEMHQGIIDTHHHFSTSTRMQVGGSEGHGNVA